MFILINNLYKLRVYEVAQIAFIGQNIEIALI